MNKWIWSHKTELKEFTCMGCEFVIRGANNRAYCVLNQNLPNGELPFDIRFAGTTAAEKVIPIIEQRILKWMLYPYQEGACSYHSEWMKIEEMRWFEQTLADWYEKPIDEWWLSVRVTNVLKSENISLQELIERGESWFRKLPHMWKKCALEVRQFLNSIGVDWRQ